MVSADVTSVVARMKTSVPSASRLANVFVSRRVIAEGIASHLFSETAA